MLGDTGVSAAVSPLAVILQGGTADRSWGCEGLSPTATPGLAPWLIWMSGLSKTAQWGQTPPGQCPSYPAFRSQHDPMSPCSDAACSGPSVPTSLCLSLWSDLQVKGKKSPLSPPPQLLHCVCGQQVLVAPALPGWVLDEPLLPAEPPW